MRKLVVGTFVTLDGVMQASIRTQQTSDASPAPNNRMQRTAQEQRAPGTRKFDKDPA
jgi:hypothetical protein